MAPPVCKAPQTSLREGPKAPVAIDNADRRLYRQYDSTHDLPGGSGLSSVIRRIASSVRHTLKQTPPVQSWENHRRFRVERALLNHKPVATADQTSVIHYSVNKAATQYTKRIMLRCGAKNGLIPVCSFCPEPATAMCGGGLAGWRTS